MNPLVKAIPLSQNFRFLVIRPLTKSFIYNPMMLLAKVAYDVFFQVALLSSVITEGNHVLD